MDDSHRVTETCPEKTLSLREMRGHIRMKEEGTPVPEWLTAHLETCKPCQSNWESLEKTDPIVRREFEERIRRDYGLDLSFGF